MRDCREYQSVCSCVVRNYCLGFFGFVDIVKQARCLSETFISAVSCVVKQVFTCCIIRCQLFVGAGSQSGARGLHLHHLVHQSHFICFIGYFNLENVTVQTFKTSVSVVRESAVLPALVDLDCSLISLSSVITLVGGDHYHFKGVLLLGMVSADFVGNL